MKTVAVLYICTGEYSIFFNNFYESCEKFFLPEFEKHYFVFTDSDNIPKAKNITLIYKRYQGFPLDSLMRFDLFFSIFSKLREFYYTFFFNSNMLLKSSIGLEILPDEQHSYLTAVKHPSYIHRRDRFYPFERRPWSQAFIPWSFKKFNYYMGSFNGGRTQEYMDLITTCREKVFKDLSNNIIAIFHDESHLNKYLSERKILELNHFYAYPENFPSKIGVKILMLEKTGFSKKFLKEDIRSKKIWRVAKRFFRFVFWMPRFTGFFCFYICDFK